MPRRNLAAHRTATVVTVPTPRFLGQFGSLRIDHTVTRLGYERVVSPAPRSRRHLKTRRPSGAPEAPQSYRHTSTSLERKQS